MLSRDQLLQPMPYKTFKDNIKNTLAPSKGSRCKGKIAKNPDCNSSYPGCELRDFPIFSEMDAEIGTALRGFFDQRGVTLTIFSKQG